MAGHMAALTPSPIRWKSIRLGGKGKKGKQKGRRDEGVFMDDLRNIASCVSIWVGVAIQEAVTRFE